ncbi:hypothetical protein EC973_003777 [Apophysomyces ossiformis]|uniref:Uncharacterized protein n=1 Tax=Apophysomyces ossiformis TaxID=679940 RepID=A0A8H7ELU5_9FUNG|nr:hypothetical protein EC973_003777 [Apophysomyces ossiformis]
MESKTDADLRAEYEERNENLKKSMKDALQPTDRPDPMQTQSNAEMQSEYNTRHENLKKSFNELWESVEQKARHAGSSNWQTQQQQQEPHSPEKEQGSADKERGFSFSKGPRTYDDPLFALGYKLNKSAMDATKRDLSAMHELDAEKFETVAAKIEDMFGNNALTEQGPDRSLYRRSV